MSSPQCNFQECCELKARRLCASIARPSFFGLASKGAEFAVGTKDPSQGQIFVGLASEGQRLVGLAAKDHRKDSALLGWHQKGPGLSGWHQMTIARIQLC